MQGTRPLDDDVPGLHVMAHEEEEEAPAAGVWNEKSQLLMGARDSTAGRDLHADGTGGAGG